MKMFITLEALGIFCSNFVYLCILTLSSHWYEKGDKASPTIISDSQAVLVKMLITLEPHSIFGSNFVCLCILTLSSHWYEKCKEASPSIVLAGRALLVKNTHNF